MPARSWLRGKRVNFHSAAEAIRHGLGMVHQHFMLVKPFTVAENIVLGQRSPRAPLLEDRRAIYRRLEALSHQYGLAIDPAAEVWTLSVGQQQRVEILKALYRGADILILDEPTAVLTPQEWAGLLEIICRLIGEGHSIVFISHKLGEVLAASNRITVMRDGRVVNTVQTRDTTRVDLACMMVGREVIQFVRKGPAHPGETVLSVRDLHADNDRGLPALRGLSLEVRAGEILGIAGVDGNGQNELEEVIAGLRRPDKGQVVLGGQDVTGATPTGFTRRVLRTCRRTAIVSGCWTISPSRRTWCCRASGSRPSPGTGSWTARRSAAMRRSC